MQELEGVGEPGRYPFTRGIHPLMYRKRPFTMRQLEAVDEFFPENMLLAGLVVEYAGPTGHCVSQVC